SPLGNVAHGREGALGEHAVPRWARRRDGPPPLVSAGGAEPTRSRRPPGPAARCWLPPTTSFPAYLLLGLANRRRGVLLRWSIRPASRAGGAARSGGSLPGAPWPCGRSAGRARRDRRGPHARNGGSEPSWAAWGALLSGQSRGVGPPGVRDGAVS